jgi:hypothetical protein
MTGHVAVEIFLNRVSDTIRHMLTHRLSEAEVFS